METDRLAALIADLDHPDKPTIRAAVEQLIELGRESARARTALDRRLTEPGHKNYWPVAYVLGHLAQPSGAAIQNLLNALEHREPDIRWACALLLQRIARAENAVIELLIVLCQSGTVNQKRMSLYCLRDLELTDGRSLQAMLELLSDRDSTVRVAAVTSLKGRGDNGDSVREELLKSYLNDVDIKVRNAAAVTLAQLGSPSEEFLRALRQVSQDAEPQAQKAAALALDLLQKK
jgi:HEAT repeat protein